MDTISNMLNSLVNAQKVGKKRVAVPYSTFKKSLLEALQQEGFVGKTRLQEGPRPKLVVALQYDDKGRPAINGIDRLSRPGRRWYASHTEIPFKYAGYGKIIISTSSGLVSDKKARQESLGGELICAIW